MPTLGRPKAVARLVASVDAATELPHTVYFVCSPGDTLVHEAVAAAGATLLVVSWNPGPGDYARKTNYGYRNTSEPWIFVGADDLVFHRGWDHAALAHADAGVIGTNDLHNPRVLRGEHATHQLVSRAYADHLGTIDGPGQILHEGYDHQFVDDEIVATARWRGRYAHAHDSHVEHVHPFFGLVELDDTYRKSHRATSADARLFQQRARRWT